MYQIILLLLSLLGPLYFSSSIVKAASPTFFPLGMFEDANQTNTTTSFQNMINDLKAHNLDTVLFTNSSNSSHLPILSVSDAANFNVIWGGPMAELNTQWFNNTTVPITIASARSIIGPLVDAVKTHSSVKGYNIEDDTTLSLSDKMKLAVQVYTEHDPSRMVSPIYVGGGNEKVFNNAQSNTFITYYYPAKAQKNACDWNFISPTQNDLSLTLRTVSRDKPDTVPLWTILQTHGAFAVTTPTADPTALRVPTVQEVSLQNWISLGEGSKGIFWFIYSTQQFWTGLKDNPTLFNEVSTLAQRTKPLTPVLQNLVKTNDYFTLSGSGNRYISTLYDPTTHKYYVLIANALCSSSQPLTVNSSVFQGSLKDLETQQVTALNSPITLNPGDGKIFEVTNLTGTIPTPTPAPNLFANASFETKSGTFPASWGGQPSSSQDSTTAHTGSNSFKFTGPSSIYTNQKLNLKAGTLYTLSYWIKTTTGMTGNGITFRAVNAGDAVNPTITVSSTKGSAFDWKQVTDTFYTPTNYIDSRFDLMWDLKAGETTNVDDVMICEGLNCLPKITQTASKIGDLDGNGKIDIFDYNTLLTNFNQSGASVVGDITGPSGVPDGLVSIYDYNLLLTNFGT